MRLLLSLYLLLYKEISIYFLSRKTQLLPKCTHSLPSKMREVARYMCRLKASCMQPCLVGIHVKTQEPTKATLVATSYYLDSHTSKQKSPRSCEIKLPSWMQHAEKQFERLTKRSRKDQSFPFFSLLPHHEPFSIKTNPGTGETRMADLPVPLLGDNRTAQTARSEWPCASRRVKRAHGEVKVMREQIRSAPCQPTLSPLTSPLRRWGVEKGRADSDAQDAGYNWLRGWRVQLSAGFITAEATWHVSGIKIRRNQAPPPPLHTGLWTCCAFVEAFRRQCADKRQWAEYKIPMYVWVYKQDDAY